MTTSYIINTGQCTTTISQCERFLENQNHDKKGLYTQHIKSWLIIGTVSIKIADEWVLFWELSGIPKIFLQIRFFKVKRKGNTG